VWRRAAAQAVCLDESPSAELWATRKGVHVAPRTVLHAAAVTAHLDLAALSVYSRVDK
jgi:hypothetical protein